MMNIFKHVLSVTAIMAAVTSCMREIPNDPDSGAFEGEVVLTTQSEVNDFKTRRSLHSLVIKGSDIKDISSIDLHAVDKLTISETSIEELVNPTFAYINDFLEISDNSKLVSIKTIGLKYCTGNITVSNNPRLENIAGLLALKKMTGHLTITGNSSLGADDGAAGKSYGFNVLKTLMDTYIIKSSQITLASNHPDAVTDPERIGKGTDGFYSYVLRNAGDLANIVTEDCQNLTLFTNGINDDVWRAIPSKGLKTIHGNLLAEGCDFTMLSAVFKAVTLKGGMTLRHFASYDTKDWKKYINSDLVPTHFGGSVILDSLLIHGWANAGFNNVTEIDGDLIVTNCSFTSDAIMTQCAKVHGNVNISGIEGALNSGIGPYGFAFGFEEIDGDLTICDIPYLNSLKGFEKVRRIGGKLLIKGNSKKVLAEGSSEGIPDITVTGRPGFDMVQQWIYDGVISPENVECYRADGSRVVFDTKIPKDWTISSAADLDAVEGEGLTARNLSLVGPGVTEAVWGALKDKFSIVMGDLVCDGCSFTMCSKFFSGVECQGSITFRNMANSAGVYLNTDNFPTHVLGNLVFDNVNIHGWAGAGLNLVEKIDGNLYIKTGIMGRSACFTKLQSVGGDLYIEGPQCDINNEPCTLLKWSIKEIGGKLSLVNTKIEDLSGFAGLLHLGSLYVKGNPISDFSQVQDWIETGVVKLAEVECYDSNGIRVNFNPSTEDDYPEYATIIKGREAFLEFLNTSLSDYRYLVIDGNGESIADNEMVRLKNNVGTVSEMLIFKNICGWTMIEQVICSKTPRITPAGGLKFMECPDLSNLNGLKWMTEINGDLVFRNCPEAVWNWGEGNCLNQIVRIKGDFTIKNSEKGLSGTSCLKSLQEVDGNLTIENNSTNFVSLKGMPLKRIGGDFRFVGNSLVTSLDGFEGVTEIGGNILIKGTAISDFSVVSNWISNSVTTKDKVQCYNASGEKVSF